MEIAHFSVFHGQKHDFFNPTPLFGVRPKPKIGNYCTTCTGPLFGLNQMKRVYRGFPTRMEHLYFLYFRENGFESLELW